MNRAFVFPGQGSQFVGMGKDLYDNFPVARLVFEEVDSSLGDNLSKIIFEGSVESLGMTEKTQPALMAVSVAVVRVIEAETGKKLSDLCNFVAGHSLGEYSALCAVGSISLSDTAKLLKIRGSSMQAACPLGKGAMVAVLGVPVEKLEEIIEGFINVGLCQIANDNSAEQVVASGEAEAVDYLIAVLKDMGKRAIKLNVSAPFHCDLMRPAAEAMQEALATVDIKVPSVSLIANVLAGKVDSSEMIRESLVKQVTGRVRWRETIDLLAKSGVTDVIELGAGKVLSNMAKRGSHGFSTVASVGSFEEVREFLKSL